jgi:RNA polymerase sigma-70 factor (ECF subfamily)
MRDPPQTRPSLLVRLRDSQDRDAWRQFVDIYVPLIYGFARRGGLQDADAADVTQEALCAVARAIKRLEYDPNRGSFRAWLLTVVRSKIANWRTRQERNHVQDRDCGAQDELDNMPAPIEETAWDQEYERRIFQLAAAQVRGQFEEASWQAFWQTALEGKSGKEVAATLGISVGAVYIAKSRVLARLKERIVELQGESS